MPVPIISVVMGVFNGERFLCEAVESILSQTFGDFEFVIIDDGSTDKSGTILESYQQRDQRIHVYSQRNMGHARSLNRGCELARGKYIARMDADDIALSNRLLRQLEFMESHPAIGLVGGAVEWIDATGKVLNLVRYPSEDCEIRKALADSSVFWHPTTFFRKRIYDVVGGYRELQDAEDYDLWLRMAEKSDLANLDEVILKYRIHPYQVSVRKCRQQALGAIAARAAALSRRNGIRDPLDSIGEITPAALAKLGVSDAMHQTSVARGYLSCIRNMANAGEYSRALKGIEELHPSEIRYADRWVVADLRLMRARLNLHEKRFARSILDAIQAILMRPIVLLRPLKRLARWCGIALRRTTMGRSCYGRVIVNIRDTDHSGVSRGLR